MISFVGNEAARAAFTKGAAKIKVAWLLICTTWSLAAQYDIAMWAERVPSKISPALLPPRNKELDLEAEPTEG